MYPRPLHNSRKIQWIQKSNLQRLILANSENLYEPLSESYAH